MEVIISNIKTVAGVQHVAWADGPGWLLGYVVVCTLFTITITWARARME